MGRIILYVGKINRVGCAVIARNSVDGIGSEVGISSGLDFGEKVP